MSLAQPVAKAAMAVWAAAALDYPGLGAEGVLRIIHGLFGTRAVSAAVQFRPRYQHCGYPSSDRSHDSCIGTLRFQFTWSIRP